MQHYSALKPLMEAFAASDAGLALLNKKEKKQAEKDDPFFRILSKLIERYRYRWGRNLNRVIDLLVPVVGPLPLDFETQFEYLEDAWCSVVCCKTDPSTLWDA